MSWLPADSETLLIHWTDPHAHPEIDPGYLTHEADIDVLAAGMKFADALANASALKDKISKRIHPPPNTLLVAPLAPTKTTAAIIRL